MLVSEGAFYHGISSATAAKPPRDQKLRANLPNWVFHKSLWLPQLYHSAFNVRRSEAAPSWETADLAFCHVNPGEQFLPSSSTVGEY